MNPANAHPPIAERSGSPCMLRAVAACLALFCLLRPAPAQDRELIGRLPDSAEVVLVVHNAAGILAEADASPFAPVLRAAGLFNRTLTAWKGLADRLGWTPRETAERLLGGTCVLVLTEPNEQAGWCLLATISAETERRLRERLEIAPADVVQGRPVLALRNGEFLLAVQQDESRQPGRRRLLLLGPSPRPGASLFNDVLPALSQDCAAPLRATPVFPLVRDAADAPIALYGNLAPTRDRRWAEHLALSVAWRPGALTCDIAARLPDAPAFAALPRTSLRAFAAAAQDAPLAIAACTPIEPLRRSGLSWSASADDPPAEPGAFERWALLLHPAPDDAAAGGPTLHRAALLVESSGPGGCDALALRLGRLLEGPQTTLGLATEGLPPATLRRTTFDAGGSAMARRIFGPVGHLAWSRCAGAAGGGGATDAGTQRWSTVALAPTQAAADRSWRDACDLASALHAPANDADRWVTVGRIDPRLFLAVAPGPWPDGSPTRTMLERLTLLAWEFRAQDDGLIRGSIRLDVAPTPPAPNAP
ncbi:MAG: hypothetical protein JNJ48_07670 [Phycisphaerae bacterium]|nr:hypothetical protein [Phycisphaerae bacterium]